MRFLVALQLTMSQLDGSKYSDNPRSPSTPTVEQLLHGGEAGSRTWSPNASPRCHDMEEDHGYHQKKSVLSKVKEKAKKWKHSLSMKKNRHSTDGDPNSTPSWGVWLEEDEDEQVPEYFGAPMYELELAPEACKESARRHPRADPVISLNHFLPNSLHHHTTDTEKTKLTSSSNVSTEKIAPINTSRSSDTSNELAKKIQGLTVSTHIASEHNTPVESQNYQPIDTKLNKSDHKRVIAGSDELPALESDELSSPGKLVSPGKQVWDKGISVKEFIMNKFEPGEDERALSQVIVDVMSPRKQPGDASMVDKVKEAISSMLWTEEPPKSNLVTAAKSSSPSSVPVSTNANQVAEEENHGKILQAN